MKKLLSVLIIIAIILAGVVLTKNVIMQAAVEKGVRLLTGLELKMSKLNLNLRGTYLRIQDLRLYNPKGSPEPVMIYMPELFVDFSGRGLLSGKLHFATIRLNLQELYIVRNKDGKLNLDALKVKQASAKEAQKPKVEQKGKAMPIQIDVLALKIGKVGYKDYSLRAIPVIQEFNINLDEEYKNIQNPAYLVSFILTRALMSTPLAALANLNLGNLQSLAVSQELATAAVGKATEAVSDLKQQATEVLTTMSGSLTETSGAVSEGTQNLAKDLESAAGGLKDAVSGLEDTAAQLKDKLKMPFGKNE
ncbi:MAG: hypothetical protein A3G33_02520 [Omnitrophica bacterium RIFCSPLOWO2_12_FULL_44_17]|uniref:Uncharacterized protein n=1 Tax=Candidatus Danuiimicrobium aquiferis TaxID=1801832 RepID=A0A1G1KW25_9BACT|nr:MAG: hypothetical protein A3B72_00405 [Omnitrophica bacterium RIFCSPHIGHO2_02_FULL_45_28]OGW88321.1 MAG: hypothetical protein A3E74_02380 [Omnitrophica bacterium RIFCSPHIGHO2_12_FULL_44_12]OGW97138.1 MAG: hypothetical protein A3G33_02520 [Omnitrophica bacterium RIFCSPLOWO2_12_FULL_44_17]OGX03872.1 MAG: hypothetical protein A3J12_02290 [Omnitrophica bacterium RIFCSPLOWO2_02_FULL_44_11]